jgi:uncharacterized protein (TIGR02231 family)
MKKIFILILFISNQLFAQNSLNVNADIQHVTVFLDKSQIDGVIKTNVGAGTTKIVVENVASTTDPNSIQVGGKGDITILGVKFSQNFLRKGKVNPIEDSLKLSKNEIETLSMLIKVAENERTMLMANANIKTEKDGISAEELKEMGDFFRTKLTEIGTRQLQLEKQLFAAREREKRLNQQLAEQAKRNQSQGEIIISVQAKNPTSIELNLSYIANNAGWSPIYDLRTKDIRSAMSLAYRANVYQNTGIDWKNVKLTLSTSNPSQGGIKPELDTQFLTVYEPQPVFKRGRGDYAGDNQPNSPQPVMAMSNEEKVAGFAKKEDDVWAAAKNLAVGVSESTLSVNFDIQIPYSIPSSGNPELVDIQNHSLNADYRYSTVPKYDTDAFLVAVVKDFEKYNLLPGKANVYFEGTFVGETQIAGSGTTDSLMVSLGRDKKIITKREMVDNFKSRKSVGSNIKETFGYRISLRNTKSEAVTLSIEDQIPVSQDSRIEVELEDAKGAALKAEDGKLTWNITLQPLDTKEIIVKYNVKYPKGKTINNL